MPQPVIRFHDLVDSRFLNARTGLKKFIAGIFKQEGIAINAIDFVFCSDDYLLDINRRFLKHDYYTDTITFKLSEEETPVIGEAYISIERIKENAELFGNSWKVELTRVIIHSTLHLCGYNDKTRMQKTEMAFKEVEFLNKYLKAKGRSTKNSSS